LPISAAPIIFLGALAPEYTGVLLGERWTLAGEMACAIAAMGADNALAAPFSEITSIFHYQLIRFVTEMTTFALVFAPFAIAIAAGWEVLPTVWGISLGGAVGSMTSLAAVWMIFRRIRVDGTALEPAAVPAN